MLDNLNFARQLWRRFSAIGWADPRDEIVRAEPKPDVARRMHDFGFDLADPESPRELYDALAGAHRRQIGHVQTRKSPYR